MSALVKALDAAYSLRVGKAAAAHAA